MEKRILLIGGNFFPELTGIGKYNGEMIHWLAKKGYQCTVIATSPYYPQWEVQEPYSNKWFKKEYIQTEGKTIEVYRCPHYVPGQPTGAKRLLSEASFSITSFLALLRQVTKKKFDYVITVVPPFQLGLHALLYRRFWGAKFFYHVQDLQIDAAKDLKIIQSDGLLNTLFRIERYILKKADVVSTISNGMIKKVKQKIGKDVVFFPNWVDSKSFFPIHGMEDIKKEYGFSANDKIVLYSGAIGEKQGLEIILNSAAQVQEKEHIKFLICGIGPYKVKLQQVVKERKLENVHFIPLQSTEKFNAFLNMADVHLIIQKKGASDLVMPSKLTTILAVGGVALVTASPGTSLYEVVAENNIAVLVEPENEKALISALLRVCTTEQSVIKENARKYAEEHLSIDKVLSKYIKHFD
jgi:colanic acid biosynthesis glycosyl transferase WcaI